MSDVPPIVGRQVSGSSSGFVADVPPPDGSQPAASSSGGGGRLTAFQLFVQQRREFYKQFNPLYSAIQCYEAALAEWRSAEALPELKRQLQEEVSALREGGHSGGYSGGGQKRPRPAQWSATADHLQPAPAAVTASAAAAAASAATAAGEAAVAATAGRSATLARPGAAQKGGPGTPTAAAAAKPASQPLQGGDVFSAEALLAQRWLPGHARPQCAPLIGR